MRSQTIVVLAALCVAALAAAPAPAAESAAQKEVRLRFLAMEKASNARDIERLTAFIDPSFTFKMPDGEIIDYDTLLDFMLKAFDLPGTLKSTSKIEKITVNGNVATITYRSTLVIAGPDGEPLRVNGRARDKWKKVGGKWLLYYSESPPAN